MKRKINVPNLLACATPNDEYVYHNNFKDVKILALLKPNGGVEYKETHTKDKDWVAYIKEETVKQLFADDCPRRDRPFLKLENLDFYAVVYRSKAKYAGKFSELKKKINSPVTTKTGFKRTK